MGKSRGFRDINLCHTNDFPAKQNDKIKGWVEQNGGTYSKLITPGVTHLVASRKAFKSQTPLVKAALAQKTIEIVNIDWLEDSLLSKSRKPKRITKTYAWCQRRQRTLDSFIRPALRPKVDRAESIEEAGIRFDSECAAFEREMSISGFHPYVDLNNFQYMINLVRKDILANELNRYRIKLFESDAIPHTYSCFVLYSRPNVKADLKDTANWATVVPAGSSWQFTWHAFRKIFKQKTGIEWERRCEPNARPRGRDSNGSNDLWDYVHPKPCTHQGLTEETTKQRKAEQRQMSMTMLVNSTEGVHADADTRAMTPEDGW